jgi:hypothetical protein
MFAVINRLKAIPGYTYGTVVSVHKTEFDALLADAQLQCPLTKRSKPRRRAALVVLPLAVCRHRGEHVRVSDLVEEKKSTGFS